MRSPSPSPWTSSRRRRKVNPVEIAIRQREGDGRQAEKHALARGGHGARVEDVDSEVLSFVDPRDDQVEGAILGNPGDGDLDAIGRTTLEAPAPMFAVAMILFQPETAHDGDGMTGAGALAMGRHDHEVAIRFEHVGQSMKARSIDAVVIAKQEIGSAVGVQSHEINDGGGDGFSRSNWLR
jgi:hypothetical protein